MNFTCDCSMTTRAVGDGCQKCNTELVIDCLPTPVELAEELAGGGFTQDQAEEVASNVYQPLLSLIGTLNDKINDLAKAV